MKACTNLGASPNKECTSRSPPRSSPRLTVVAASQQDEDRWDGQQPQEMRNSTNRRSKRRCIDSAKAAAPGSLSDTQRPIQPKRVKAAAAMPAPNAPPTNMDSMNTAFLADLASASSAQTIARLATWAACTATSSTRVPRSAQQSIHSRF
jgi:hypothetical protein